MTLRILINNLLFTGRCAVDTMLKFILEVMNRSGDNLS